MRRAALLCLVFLLPSPAPACSLCGNLARTTSLVEEFDEASYIVYGRLANPKLDFQPKGGGNGTTEFHLVRVIKDNPAIPKQNMILLNRYVPVLDPKAPPRYVLFFRTAEQAAQPYLGREITSPAVLDFAADLNKERKDPGKMLLLAAKHFDNADAAIAEEAFLVFARADDKVIAQVARKLSPDILRKLVKSPNLEPERLSMFAYLLGACGDAKDGDLLRDMLKGDPTLKNHKAYEGILAGYITNQPKDGWAYAHALLKSEKTPFLLRYAALRTLRFFYNANSDGAGQLVVQGLGLAIALGDVSDIAITDLRAWKRWEHTKLIIDSYDRPTHRAPIVKNSIVRYALACPQPEARAFVERVRRQDPELVKYLEEELK